LQPRPRKSKTLATKEDRPTRVEHEYDRCGALNQTYSPLDCNVLTGLPLAWLRVARFWLQ
jgi:hypothetical protein